MLEEFFGVLLMLLFAWAATGALALLPRQPRARGSAATDTAPSAVRGRLDASPRQRFPIRFVLVLMLGMLCELGLMFLYPGAALFRELSWYGFAVAAVFTVPFAIGLVYAWRKGAFQW